MAFRRRGPKKKPDTLGRLMIELRTRSKVWVPCSPEDGEKLRQKIADSMRHAGNALIGDVVIHLDPYLSASVRVEAIEAVQFFASKTPAESPEESK